MAWLDFHEKPDVNSWKLNRKLQLCVSASLISLSPLLLNSHFRNIFWYTEQNLDNFKFTNENIQPAAVSRSILVSNIWVSLT